MPADKHVPLRTCIACGKVRPQREMVRLVCAGNTVEVDAGGRKAGRGSYICREAECWQLGLKGNRLERALRTSLMAEDRHRLDRQLKEFCGSAGK
jgi:uncharacterized protein